ncbi:Hypothetical protein FKW44_013369, partial [Caligus rogercresseyi]
GHGISCKTIMDEGPVDMMVPDGCKDEVVIRFLLGFDISQQLQTKWWRILKGKAPIKR